MNFTLIVWRQKTKDAPGKMVEYQAREIAAEASFLEMLDVVNEDLLQKGEEPIAFEHDCREGICGSCGVMINGKAHGGFHVATCQVYMRQFPDGTTLYLEPWRSRAFPVLRDLMVDRSAFDRIIQAGGFVSVNSGTAPDGNAIAISKVDSDLAMDAASCIGCGACVAQCPNGAAQLFTSAKISHLALLPQGQPERYLRVESMVAQLEEEMFGSCTNYGECEAVCPKQISVDFIAQLNRDYLKAKIAPPRFAKAAGGAG